EVARRATSRIEARGKGILLLHDIHPRTVLALPEILNEFKSHGYKIVHVVPAAADRPKTANGISYEPAQKPKSDLYREMLPAINSRKLDLLDDARLLTQLVGLERRSARGGRGRVNRQPSSVKLMEGFLCRRKGKLRLPRTADRRRRRPGSVERGATVRTSSRGLTNVVTACR